MHTVHTFKTPNISSRSTKTLLQTPLEMSSAALALPGFPARGKRGIKTLLLLFQIVLQSTVGYGDLGDIAVDDFSMYLGRCL